MTSNPSRDREYSLHDALGFIRRRALTFVVTGVVAAASGYAYLKTVVPVYRSEATVMVEGNHTRIVQEEISSSLSANDETIRTQMLIVESPFLAERVIKKLDLLHNPEFYANEGGDSQGADATEVDPRQMTRATEVFKGRLKVVPYIRSFVIAVHFDSHDPELAAKVANTLVDEYIIDQLEAKFRNTQVATQWLSKRLGTMRQQVETAEQAVAAYRSSHGLVKVRSNTVNEQQLSEVNSELVKARSDRSTAEVRIRQVREALARGAYDSVAEVTSNVLIQNLRQQEAQLTRRAAELSTTYLKSHPLMLNVQAEISEMRGKIRAEVDRAVSALENEASMARAREASLSQTVNALRNETGDLEKANVELRALEREADASRVLFENFLSRFQQASAQESLQQADARVISYASAPLMPNYPRKGIWYGLILAGSLLLGLIAALMRELLERGFQTAEQLAEQTGESCLSSIPETQFDEKKGHIEDYVLDHPTSSFAETIRAVYTAVLLSEKKNDSTVLLVSSSIPGEGKTLMASSLARTAALSGRRALAIDCDMRRPRLMASRNKKKGKRPLGLTDYLQGTATLEEVLHVDERSGATFITSGTHITSPGPLVSSERLSDLIAALRKDYDLIVLDTPPVGVVSDARALARLVDKIIFMVHWRRTPRATTIACVEEFRGLGTTILGTVMSRVNIRQGRTYGYYYGYQSYGYK